MTIGVFFGGKSPEHDVSIITGELIISELKKMNYSVVPIYVGKDGRWFIDESLGELKFFQKENKEELLRKYTSFYLELEESQGKMVFKKKGLLSEKKEIHLAFPAFHGSYGEDGTIQGLFEMMDIPYVGCDVSASSLAFDKILTKLMYVSRNISTAPFVYFTNADWKEKKETLLNEIMEKLKFPVFVKPPKLGSSIGITKAKDKKELEFGIEVALHYGDRVLVEEGINNLMDITCCIIGNEELTASLVQESAFSSDLFNFEEKYLKDGGAQFGNDQSSLIIPARLDEETTAKVQTVAKEIYTLLGCSGIARVDFLYDKVNKKLFASEVNPLPGTLYHHLWKSSGMELSELIKKLIQFANDRQEKKKKITYSFETTVLKMANSMKLQIKNK